MPLPPPRDVTLVLCRGDGAVLGALPPFRVEVPWWQEAAPVVEAARARFGIDVTVLRLLEAAGTSAHGGAVTYLAEVARDPGVPLASWRGAAEGDEPLRLPYARPGGPARDVAWARAALAARGTPVAGPPAQVRTWNLSSLWRLPLAAGAAWLKVVPRFFAHEGAMLARLDPAAVPRLIASDGPRVLMEELPGEDQRGAPLPRLLAMVRLLVGLQASWTGRLGELAAVGAPDWRAAAFPALADHAAARSAGDLEAPERAAVARLLAGLPARFAALAACGVPDTLVHGDFHPGNVRGDGRRIVLLDWGDCGMGHPLLDQAAFLAAIEPAARAPVARAWADAWRRAVPGAEPERAAALLAPIGALRLVTVYRRILDGIEPAEHPYHAADPAVWLRKAIAVAAGAPSPA